MEFIYLYDGSFEGFLCCIFESYANRELPSDIIPETDACLTLFQTRHIETDKAHADRVLRKTALLSGKAVILLRRGFLTCLANREMYLYHLIAKLLREGPGFLRNLADETLLPVLKAVRHLEGEVQLLRGFVRFSDYSGILGGEIEPKNRVLPLLRSHFCSRFPNERFFIYDRTHREALFYADGKAVIAPLERFEAAAPDETEVAFRRLWKRFYDTVAIKERENFRCRQTHMPKRYWGTMTEFQDEDYFIAGQSPRLEHRGPGLPSV
ncbi:TIGR03915 family putative DNA repair protein [Oscillibacter sp.]|uniref:TIGR03915 family putative DNA repair protein n=1 Tax=Oscillibacter sp. TaxID=1945593 RepID=UPI0028AE6648|nr:TIGR03915 family putative DNA repair protein [Oscillibacter sp.]